MLHICKQHENVVKFSICESNAVYGNGVNEDNNRDWSIV